MINISNDIIASIVNAVSQAIQQLWIVIAVPLGIIIAFYAIRKILFMITLSKR